MGVWICEDSMMWGCGGGYVVCVMWVCAMWCMMCGCVDVWCMRRVHSVVVSKICNEFWYVSRFCYGLSQRDKARQSNCT